MSDIKVMIVEIAQGAQKATGEMVGLAAGLVKAAVVSQGPQLGKESIDLGIFGMAKRGPLAAQTPSGSA